VLQNPPLFSREQATNTICSGSSQGSGVSRTFAAMLYAETRLRTFMFEERLYDKAKV
jgi:hypothetical protein